MTGRKPGSKRRALWAGLMCGGLFGCTLDPATARLVLPSMEEGSSPAPGGAGTVSPPPALPLAAYAGGASQSPEPRSSVSPGEKGIRQGRIALSQKNRWDSTVLLYEAATLQPLAISPEPPSLGPELPHVSADGRYVVYVGRGVLGRRAVLWDIEQAREIALPGLARVEIHDPDLAGDGASLVLMTGPVSDPELAIYDVSSGALTPVKLPTSLSRNARTPSISIDGLTGASAARTPSISADGQTAAYVARSPLGDDNIVVINLRTQTPLAPPTLNSGADDVEPVLSADGRLLLFSSNRNGSYDLYGYDLVAQRYVDLGACNSLADERAPRFLGLDEGGFCFGSDRRGTSEVYVRPLGDWRTP